jgi:nitrite reductase (NADH) large subunit
VELASRLMPLQVDEAGGAMLRRHIEDVVDRPHRTDAAAGRGTSRRGRPGCLRRRRRPRDRCGDLRGGVRPRDELARRPSGRGSAGWIVVDDACRSSDPDIYAIGEWPRSVVASTAGRPGYAMAEVVADRLLGGDATFPARTPLPS